MQFFLALALLLLASPLAFSEEITNLEKQIITAGDSSKQNNHIQIITRDQFIGQYSSVTDVLKNTLGVQVRGGGIGDPVDLSIRGSTHNQITFIIDDHKVNDSKYGGFDPNKIPLNQIQSISIHQGIDPSTNTIGAIGGTIVIKTLSSNLVNDSIYTSYATYNTHSAGFLKRFNKIGAGLISYDYLSSDANYKYEVYTPYSDPNNFNHVEQLHNNEYYSHTMLGKWQSTYSKDSHSGIELRLASTNKGLPNYNQNPKQNNAKLLTKERDVKSFFKFRVSENIENKLELHINSTDELVENSSGFVGYGSSKNAYKNSKYSITDKFSYITNNLESSIFASTEVQRFDENNHLISSDQLCKSEVSVCDNKAEQISTIGGSNISLYSPTMKNRITLSAALKSVSRKQTSKYGLLEDQSSKKQYSSWSASWDSDITQNTSVSINTGRAIRIPSLFEQYGDRGFQLSNDDLKPEISHSSSANASYQFNRFSLSGSIYYRKVEDLIINEISNGIGRYGNISSAEIAGFQNSVKYKAKSVGFSFDVQIQDSLTGSKNVSLDSKQVPNVYHESYLASISYAIKRINVEYQYKIEREIYADSANLVKLPNNEVSNLKLSYRSMAYQMYFNIGNAFNKQNTDIYNRPSPGRTLSLSLHFTI